ncbi:hypothetical protein FBQ95_16900 [Chloroflexi bacterium CFX3]|nr:hypothetical protein [Chloroflexi bacterium CFX3]
MTILKFKTGSVTTAHAWNELFAGGKNPRIAFVFHAPNVSFRLLRSIPMEISDEGRFRFAALNLDAEGEGEKEVFIYIDPFEHVEVWFV